MAVFMSSQAISLFGSSLVQYAITWHITLTTKSGVAATLAIVCGFLPTLLLSPFAGVWADRYNRKVLIMIADGSIAFATLVLAVVYMAGYKELWMLYAVLAVRAFGSAVQMPCVNAMLPDIAPSDQLVRVNGLNGTIQSLITLASPMMSGALMGFAPLEYIFFIDVFTAAAAISVMMWFLKVPSSKKPAAATEQNPDYFRELREGFGYVKNSRLLRNFLVYMAIANLMVAPAAFLTPLQVARFFGDQVWRLSVVEMAFSVGAAVGGLTIAMWGGFKNKTHTLCASIIIMGFCTIALGLPDNFWVYTAVMVIFGLAMPAMNTPAIAMLQERVDPDYIGRVFGLMGMITSSIMPLAMLIFGPLGDIVPLEYIMLGTGLVILVLGVSIMFNRVLVDAGLPARKEAQI